MRTLLRGIINIRHQGHPQARNSLQEHYHPNLQIIICSKVSNLTQPWWMICHLSLPNLNQLKVPASIAPSSSSNTKILIILHLVRLKECWSASVIIVSYKRCKWLCRVDWLQPHSMVLSKTKVSTKTQWVNKWISKKIQRRHRVSSLSLNLSNNNLLKNSKRL